MMTAAIILGILAVSLAVTLAIGAFIGEGMK
jgi:hypothetical protein